MQKSGSSPGKGQVLVFFLMASLVVAADQVSKLWIRTHLALGQSSPETGWLRLTHIHNSGAAFGLFQGQVFSLTLLALVGIVVVLGYALFAHRWSPLPKIILGEIALGLVLGGTIGNLIDRLRFGYITDFIAAGFWPAFNLADSAIVVGACIFAYVLLFLARGRRYQTMSR